MAAYRELAMSSVVVSRFEGEGFIADRLHCVALPRFRHKRFVTYT